MPAHYAENALDEQYSRISGWHEVSLAERLGLHAPFRTFGDGDGDGDGELGHGTNATHRKAKRRRTLSSSLLLEPAEIDLGLGQEEEEREDLCKPRARTKGYPLHNGGISGSEKGPKPSNSAATKPKSYERRSRHKTREDRYDLKQDTKRPTKKQKKAGAAGKDRKRKRKEKSGNTLMHDFTASNVAQDRLTVSKLAVSMISPDFVEVSDYGTQIKPAASLGLFGKGRASSPVRRKGCESGPPTPSLAVTKVQGAVPDLTFSEMTFLNSRRAQPTATERQPAERIKRQKKEKTEDTEAAISRYFTSKCPRANPGPGTGRKADSSGIDLPRDNSHNVRRPPSSSLPPVELPDRPFLGFGSSGASLTSPVKPGKHCATPLRRSRPSLENQSTADSTSYYTWSRSAQSLTRAPTPSPRHRSRSLQIRRASPKPVHVSRLEETSVAEPDFAVSGFADNSSIHSAHVNERARAEDIVHRKTPNHREPNNCEEPVSCNRPATITKGKYGKALVGDTDAVTSDRAVSGQSSRKLISEENFAKHKTHIEAQFLEKGPLVTVFACKESRPVDSALEHLLHAGQKVFGSSAPPENAMSVAVQDRPAIELENEPLGTPTIRASQRKDATTPERAYHFSTASMAYKGPSARAPTPPNHAYPQEQQCRERRDSAYAAFTQLTSPRIVHEPTNLRLHGIIAMDFSRSSESRAHSGGAWNAYQNLYQMQLMAIPKDSYLSEGGLRGFESWVGEPDPRASFQEAPYLGAENPGERERLPDQFFEDNGLEQIVYEEANFASPLEQSMPFENEDPPYDELESGAGKHWERRNNAFDPYINGLAFDAQQAIGDTSDTKLVSANFGPTATTVASSPSGTMEAILTGKGAGYQSHDRFEDWNEGVNRRTSQLEVDQDGHLSNFWKPNRLY